MDEFVLDELDYKILNLISNDTRISFLEVSRICNVSGAAVHQRVQKMIAHNIITGSELHLNYNRIGYETCAYLNLTFNEQNNLEDIVKELNSIPEIVECNVIMGVNNLFVKIYAHNNEHLLDIVNGKIKPLGLIKLEHIMSCKEIFRKQIVFDL